MEKLKLPQVTLVAMTGKSIPEHIRALKESSRGIEWGKVLLLSPEIDSISWGNRHDETGFENFCLENKKIEPIESIDDWNYKIIYDLPNYISTSHCLLIHADGFVVSPEKWREFWLEFDYIGAPWPLPGDDYSYRNEDGEIERVGNSVSLRSKRLMELIATRPKEDFWAVRGRYGNSNEDGFICCHNRKWLESQGCKFAPLEVAVHFSKEHTIEENKDVKETFCFHSL